jgi:hypothetical protein
LDSQKSSLKIWRVLKNIELLNFYQQQIHV